MTSIGERSRVSPSGPLARIPGNVESFATSKTLELLFLSLRELRSVAYFRHRVARRIEEYGFEALYCKRSIEQTVVDSSLEAGRGKEQSFLNGLPPR